MKILRTSTYCSLVTVTAARDYSMKIGRMMPLVEIAANTMHLGECRDLVATSLGLQNSNKTFVLEFAFPSRWKWASSEVQRRFRKSGVSLIFSSILTAIALLCFLSEAVRVCFVCIVWVSPDIVYQHYPASLTGHTQGLTSLTHRASPTLLERLSHTFDQLGFPLLGTSRVAWTVLTGSVEVLHGLILLEVVHPVLNSTFG